MLIPIMLSKVLTFVLFIFFLCLARNCQCINAFLKVRAVKGEHEVCVSGCCSGGCPPAYCCAIEIPDHVGDDVLSVMPGSDRVSFLLQCVGRVGAHEAEGLDGHSQYGCEQDCC